MTTSGVSSPRRNLYLSVTDKTRKLLREEFNNQTSPNEPSKESLDLLRSYANSMALENGVSVQDSLDDMNDDHLLIYSLLILSNSQYQILQNNPDIINANQLAIANIASSFGVPQQIDSEMLLQSIATRFNIKNYDKIGEEIKNRLLCMPKLISKFGLDKSDPNLLFNPDNLFLAIRNKCEDSSFLDRLTDFLDLPNDTSEETVIRYLSKKLELEDQTDTILILKKQNKELRDKISDLKSASKIQPQAVQSPTRSTDSDTKLYEAEKQLADRKATVLQVKVNSLESEVESLKAQIEKMRYCPNESLNEMKMLKESNSFLEKQFNNQIQELKNGSDNRRELIRIIQKQSQLIYEYDKMLSDRSKNELISPRLRKIVLPPVDDQTISTICDSIENAPSEIVDEILKILNSENLTKLDKVKRTIEYFIDKIRKEQQKVSNAANNNGSFKNLVYAMHSQLHFLENLIDCDEDIQFLFDDPEEAKKSLMHQANQINEFLATDAKGFVEDANIFDSMQLNADPQEISDHLNSFFDKYKKIQTNEGEELLVLLRQAFAVNSILRRFALTARNQCEKQSNDIRLLVSEFKRLQDSRNQIVSTMKLQVEKESQARQTAELNVKKLKALIKSNAEIMQREAKARGNPDDLRRELVQAKAELQKVSNELEEEKENKAKLNDYQIQSLNKDVKNLNSKLAASHDENEQLKEQLNYQKEEFDRKEKSYNQKIELLKQTIDVQNNDISELQEERKKSEIIRQKFNKLQIKHQSDIDTVADLTAKVKRLETACSKLANESQTQNENSLQLDEQLKQAQSKILSKEFDEKLHQQKIISLQKEIEREKQNFEAIINLQKTAAQSEIDSSIQKVREELLNEKQAFLSKICYELSPYYDFTSSINENSAIETLQNFKSKFKELQQQKSELKQQLNQVRAAFGIQKHADVVSFANDTVRQINDNSRQLNDLQKQLSTLENSPAMKNNQSAREWEEWARGVYLNIQENSSVVATTSMVRKGIEEAVGIAPNNSEMLSKIESLKIQKKIIMQQKNINEIFGKSQLRSTQFSKIASIRPFALALSSINRIRKSIKHSLTSQKQKQYQNIYNQSQHLQENPQQHQNTTHQNQNSSLPNQKQSFFSINLNDEDESDNYSPVPIFNNIAEE